MSDQAPEDTTSTIKCPVCGLRLPEEDFERQRVHLMANHPALVEERLREHRKWDGWEDG